MPVTVARRASGDGAAGARAPTAEETVRQHLLDARALEAGLDARRRPEVPSATERPQVAEGELAVFVHPICPFAHRAWICALEKLGEGGFRAIGIDLNDKPAWYPEVYAAATVPAVQHGPEFCMGDSAPVCEWMEATWPGRGTPLAPGAGGEAAAVAVVMGEFGERVVGPCYRLLRNADAGRDGELAAAVLSGAAWFDARLAARGAGAAGGPFFLGRFSMFEVLAYPFFDRFRHTLRHWRGVDVAPPRLAALTQWLAAVDERPSARFTRRSAEYYIGCYAGYAKGERRAPPAGC